MAIRTSLVSDGNEVLKPDDALRRIRSMTPAAAQMLVSKIQAPNSELAAGLLDGKHPNRKQMLEEWNVLHTQAQPGGAGNVPSPSPQATAALRRIDEIESNPALMDRFHRQHNRLIAERSQLYDAAYPEQPKTGEDAPRR